MKAAKCLCKCDCDRPQYSFHVACVECIDASFVSWDEHGPATATPARPMTATEQEISDEIGEIFG